MRKIVVVALACLTVFGLASHFQIAPAEAEEYRTTTQPVIDGRPVNPNEFYSTVAIIDLVIEPSGPIPVCTGTLIAPTVVLSAAHCVVEQDANTDEIIEEFTPDSMGIYAGGADANGLAESDVYEVKQIIRHSSYPNPGGDPNEPSGIGESNDIAIFILNEAVTEVSPIKILPDEVFDQELTAGKSVIITGYGGRESVEGTNLAGELYIAETPFQFATQKEFIAGGPGNPDTCPGDSGGPVYVRASDGALYVIGASSRADNTGSSLCGEGGIYTLASAYVDWIVQQSGGAYQPATGFGNPNPNPNPDPYDDEDDCGCTTVQKPVSSSTPLHMMVGVVLMLGAVVGLRRRRV